jgi:hypothetical protein
VAETGARDGVRRRIFGFVFRNLRVFVHAFSPLPILSGLG